MKNFRRRNLISRVKNFQNEKNTLHQVNRKKNSNETIIYISGTEFYFEHEKCQYSDDYSTIVQNIFPLVNLHMLFLPLYSKILPQFLNDSAYTKRVLDLQEIIGESDLV